MSIVVPLATTAVVAAGSHPQHSRSAASRAEEEGEEEDDLGMTARRTGCTAFLRKLFCCCCRAPMADVLYPADVRRWLLLKHQVRIPYEPGNEMHESMLLELWTTAFPHAVRIQPISV